MYRYPLTRPYITDAARERVLQVLDSRYLTEGAVAAELERSVAHYCGVGNAVAVNNATTGLEMVLRVLGIGPGDEVIVPDYTHPATAAVVRLVGATLVFVDVDADTMLVNYDAMEEAVTERTKAVIPVSQFGNPLNYDRLAALKQKYGFIVAEDAACSIGAAYRDRRVGSLADVSVFSFHPRKFITTGEGGMVTTQNDDWARGFVSHKHFGATSTETRAGTEFSRIGTNYKLSDVLAAIGLAQMQEIDQLLAERIRVADRYRELLDYRDDVRFQRVTEGGEHSYQSVALAIPSRDRVLERLRTRGIEAQIGTFALSLHGAFQPGEHVRHHGDLGQSRKAFADCLVLPSYHGMSEQDQEYIVGALVEELSEEDGS